MIINKQSELPKTVIALSLQALKLRRKFNLDELAKKGMPKDDELNRQINKANF